VTLQGRATAEGTASYAGGIAGAAEGHFRWVRDWRLSSIGIGTYLGNEDQATDAGYAVCMERALTGGCNVVDTAVNYRAQRSERTVGRTLAQLVASGRLRREEVVVATKGGFLTPDSERAESLRVQVEETLLRPGIITVEDIVAGCHCMTPGYLRHQVQTSLRNLDMDTIDIYYVHNPETQLQEVSAEELDRRLRLAFEALEAEVEAGRIAAYGTATWAGFRRPPGRPGALSFRAVLDAARDAGGEGHHFRAVQLPVNLAMPEAIVSWTQEVNGNNAPLLHAASASEVVIMASGSLLQARLTRGLPDDVRQILGEGLRTDAQRALQFARSAPGVATALVGMSTPAHADENLELVGVPPLEPEQLAQLIA